VGPHHQAAHAVAGLRLVVCRLRVTIVPSGSTLGVASGQDPFSSGRLDERTGEAIGESKRFFERWRTLPDRSIATSIAGAERSVAAFAKV